MPERPEIEITENFLDNPEALFEVLRKTVSWESSMSARLTASFGVPYNYRQMVYPEQAMHPKLVPVVEQLAQKLGFTFNNCLLNFYPDGHSKMGFHSDDTSELVEGTGVAIVSLGHPRKITFRGRENIERRYAVVLEPGSLLFMPNSVQAEWAHAIKRQANAGPRISLTWRAFTQPASR